MWIGICKLFDMPEKQQGKCHTGKTTALNHGDGRKHMRGGEERQKGRGEAEGAGRGRRALWPQSLELQSWGVPIRLDWPLLSFCFWRNKSHLKQNGHHYLGVATTQPQSRSPRSCFAECFFLRSHWCLIERFLLVFSWDKAVGVSLMLSFCLGWGLSFHQHRLGHGSRLSSWTSGSAAASYCCCTSGVRWGLRGSLLSSFPSVGRAVCCALTMTSGKVRSPESKTQVPFPFLWGRGPSMNLSHNR